MMRGQECGSDVLCSSPFKGKAGRGMGFASCELATHPHQRCALDASRRLPLKGRGNSGATVELAA